MPALTPSVTRWWWIRHAPVSGIAPGRLYGADAAADLGDRARLDWLRARLPADHVLVTSGLRRATETAAVLSPASALTEPALAEQDFGRWVGFSHDELAPIPAYNAFWADPVDLAPPGGESFADQCRRVGAAIQRLGADHAGRDIVAVCHGGTIRAALGLALGLAPANALCFVIGHWSLTRIDLVEASWRVVGVNLPEA